MIIIVPRERKNRSVVIYNHKRRLYVSTRIVIHFYWVRKHVGSALADTGLFYLSRNDEQSVFYNRIMLGLVYTEEMDEAPARNDKKRRRSYGRGTGEEDQKTCAVSPWTMKIFNSTTQIHYTMDCTTDRTCSTFSLDKTRAGSRFTLLVFHKREAVANLRINIENDKSFVLMLHKALDISVSVTPGTPKNDNKLSVVFNMNPLDVASLINSVSNKRPRYYILSFLFKQTDILPRILPPQFRS
jgi:hypothetical protein